MRSAESVNKYRIRVGTMGSQDSIGMYGAFWVPRNGVYLACIANDGGESGGWEHVSVVVRFKKNGRELTRTPTWEEMCFVKDLFWPEEETVIQYHPPKSEYVNNHPHCLHLWRNEKEEVKLPPSILVGIKEGV